jgi:hypothetical protein
LIYIYISSELSGDTIFFSSPSCLDCSEITEGIDNFDELEEGTDNVSFEDSLLGIITFNRLSSFLDDLVEDDDDEHDDDLVDNGNDEDEHDDEELSEAIVTGVFLIGKSSEPFILSNLDDNDDDDDDFVHDDDDINCSNIEEDKLSFLLCFLVAGFLDFLGLDFLGLDFLGLDFLGLDFLGLDFL